MNFVQLFTLNTMTATSNSGITGIINNAKSQINTIVAAVVGLLGLILIAYGVFQVWKNLTSNQPGSWLKAIACIFIGGFMAFGSYSSIKNFAKSGNDTINNIANGTGGGNADTVVFSHDVHLPNVDFGEK